MAWYNDFLRSCRISELMIFHAGGLQVGGGINSENALEWLSHGASKVRKVFAVVSSTDTFLC